MDRWPRDQAQPGSLFQRLREAEKRDPGNMVGLTSDRDHIEIFVLLPYTFLRDSVLVISFDTFEPRLSGLVGTSVKSPDNRESG